MQTPICPVSCRTCILRGKLRSTAFTLIELLIVIGIIAVLAAMAYPALNRVQANAEATQCSNNLRQIGVAMMAFAGENDGTFPLSADFIPYKATGTPPLGWTQQLETYLPTNSGSNLKIFNCRSTTRFNPSNVNYSYFNGCRAAYLDSLANDPTSSTHFAAVKLSRIQFPSKLILGGDVISSAFQSDDADKDDSTKNPLFKDPVDVSTIPGLHNGKANILFADGHLGSFSSFQPTQMTVEYARMVDYDGTVSNP